MKSVLIYANRDDGLEGRLQAGFDLGRAFDAHLTCLQVTPYQSYVSSDPFGGIYAIPEVLAVVSEEKAANRALVEQKLGSEGALWSWLEADGNPGQSLVQAGHLSDLTLLSLAGDKPEDLKEVISVIGNVVVNGRNPILAVPANSRSFDCYGTATVAWNGAPESSHALRAALPMLKKASAVHVISVAESERGFPATQACEYLGWHGLKPVLHEVLPAGRSVADALLDEAVARSAAYIVAGAYGHSRFREAVLGGVTLDLLTQDEVPLLLGR